MDWLYTDYSLRENSLTETVDVEFKNILHILSIIFHVKFTIENKVNFDSKLYIICSYES